MINNWETPFLYTLPNPDTYTILKVFLEHFLTQVPSILFWLFRRPRQANFLPLKLQGQRDFSSFIKSRFTLSCFIAGSKIQDRLVFVIYQGVFFINTFSQLEGIDVINPLLRQNDSLIFKFNYSIFMLI